jgi:hypothetical protein
MCRDYRWADFPARGYIVPHPHDVSVQTFRGHTVLQTLIRAYFSPAHSTGQRFVYTGSADGAVRIYGERPLVCHIPEALFESWRSWPRIEQLASGS